jgi:hypothetical protein
MFWAQMKVLLPSFFGYWVFMVVLASATWYGWTKIYTNVHFKWHAPVLVATTAAFYLMASTLIGFYQNNALFAYQQKMQATQQAAAQQQKDANVDPATKAKGDFLKIVEQLMGAPDQITPENKQKLFTQYASLFPNGNTDRQIYEKEILAVYNCQRYFWEDAMASYKAKKTVKSDSRKECETLPGQFFNREKLVTAETAKANDQTISRLSAHKRLPASDGKEVEVNEKMLRNALDAQVKAIDAIKKIFN